MLARDARAVSFRSAHTALDRAHTPFDPVPSTRSIPFPSTHLPGSACLGWIRAQ
jgi:hypothetical protein